MPTGEYIVENGIGFYHGDCMDFMREKPDGYYDLAVVDPPYGDVGLGGVLRRSLQVRPEVREIRKPGMEKASPVNHLCGGRRARYNVSSPDGDLCAERAEAGASSTKIRGGTLIDFWDYAPPQEYFDELFRVSRNQIIWGGNYFSLPPCRCFLVWRKLTISEKFSMAMAEYAWTSFNGNAKVFECAPQGTAKEPRFHVTQKSVKLYTWCLGLFAKKGMKILDTHGGSMSSAIASYEMGLDMDICEINDFYFEKGTERVRKAMRQEMIDFGEDENGNGDE